MGSHESAPTNYQDESDQFDYAELEKMVAGNASDKSDTLKDYGMPAGGPVVYPEGSPWKDFDEFAPRIDYDYSADYQRMNDTESPLQKQIRERNKAESDAREAAWGRDS